MKFTKVFFFAALLSFVSACGGNSEEKEFRAEMKKIDGILGNVESSLKSFQNNPSPEALQGILDDMESCHVSAYDFDFGLSPEQEADVEKMENRVKSMKSEITDVCDEFVSSFFKTVEDQEVLLEEQKVYPMYLKKGTTLKLDCHSDAPLTLNFYNSDSRKLLKSFKKAEVCEDITIPNTAIYLVEFNVTEPQYCNINISHSVTSFDEYFNTREIQTEVVETTAGAFRAKKVPGIQLKPVFEEPHKITLRSKGKNILDTSSPYRSITAVKIPSGSSDILYHLRISTTDSSNSSDGQFCKDVSESYRKIKFLGLPLYESSKSSTNIFRELLNGLTVVREEKAYCNFFVFNSQSQAKKFQTNAQLSDLTYNMDYSCTGTQSRNERIPVKGMNTIYLGFENTREFHDVFLWLEVIATVPNDVYYTEKYSLK